MSFFRCSAIIHGHGFVDLAIREKDQKPFEMLQWFVKEQVEEEEHAREIVNQIKIVGDIVAAT